MWGGGSWEENSLELCAQTVDLGMVVGAEIGFKLLTTYLFCDKKG